MKLFKKISYLFLVLIIIMSLTGCQNNNSNSEESDTAQNTNEESNNIKSEFDKYNVLSFSEVEIDKTPQYEGDNYYHFKVKVTNNSSDPVRTITPVFYAYDKEGTMLVSVAGQELGSVEGNKSLYIKGSVEKDKNIDNVKINNYSYYIDKTYYNVDLISEVVDIAQ